VDVRETVALDIGASTGGFTDCLLQRGARRVYAVDCGTGQLHATLRNDTRVVSMERCNARHLTREEIPTVPEIVVADVSFISLRLIIPVVAKLGGSGTIVIMLVKPQFEAGPAQVQRGGVVRDAAVRRAAVDSVRTAMADAGWQVFGELESPLRGPAGNIEYLLGARM
jgi:23S rRNA (cytidine1920-2'-O)/16S rRNA (cytidine1409-2'-O)-methyltransferase